MKRTLMFGALVAIGWLGLVSASDAQVFIRAPFVRVGVGDGVYVRAPFVNLYVPPSGPVYGPRVVYVPSQFMPPASEPLPAPLPEKAPFKPPLPKPVVPEQGPVPAPLPENPPLPKPMAAEQGQAVTLESFAKNFQPKAGKYEVTIINPVTNQPNAVRFTLPEGTPRRTVVTRDSIDFVYSLRQRVLIDFDRDGAHVIAR